MNAPVCSDPGQFKNPARDKNRWWTMQSDVENAGEEFARMFAAGGLPQVEPATSRSRGQGPFKRLVLRGASIIDGTGAPPWGPADLVVEGGRITALKKVGTP